MRIVRSPGSVLLVVLALGVVSVVAGCNAQRSAGARTYEENMVAVRCPRNTRPYCRAVGGNRFSGERLYTHCTCGTI